MEIRPTALFLRDYEHLPRQVQVSLDKKLARLAEDLRYPSLRAKKMEGYENIWEARITKGYRFTFSKDETGYFIRRAGPHDVLRNP